jgi:hypothetical protein
VRIEKNQLYFGILVLNLLCYSTFFFLSDINFHKIAKEDGFFENGTAILFLIISVLFFLLFFRKDFFYQGTGQLLYSTYSKRIFFILFALMFFVFFGEEISWGQRILGFETPETIKVRNMQKEFNIHNIDVLHHWGEEKEFKTGITKFITAKRIFIYTFVLYLLIVPFLFKKSELFRRLAKTFYLPIPKIELGYLFVVNLIIYNAFKWHYGYIKTVRVMGEVEEFNFALILLFLPLIWLKLPTKNLAS